MNSTFIDSFHLLTKNHHQKLKNFQIAGTSLEIAAKIYSIKLDELYKTTEFALNRMANSRSV